MTYDPEVHHRRSIRLRGYDYSRPGAYAVTICTRDKQALFGEIVEGKMVLNELGQMVQDTWKRMPSRYPGCALDAFVVMPNHVKIREYIATNPIRWETDWENILGR